MELTDLPGIGPAYAKRLREADVADAEALANVTMLQALSARTGIPLAKLNDAHAAARERVGHGRNGASAHTEVPERTAAEAVQAVAETVVAAARDMRVVLQDRALTARVKIGSIWHEDVPVVAARLEENERRVLESIKENVVVLKEKADAAVVRLGGDVHEAVPLFKERVLESAGDVREEIRVRVQEIRRRVPEARASLLARLLRRGPRDEAENA